MCSVVLDGLHFVHTWAHTDHYCTDFIWGKFFKKATDRRHQELLHLLHGSPHLDLGSRLRVLHCDENVQVLVQVLPVWLPSVLLLLKWRRRGEWKSETCLWHVTWLQTSELTHESAPVWVRCESARAERTTGRIWQERHFPVLADRLDCIQQWNEKSIAVVSLWQNSNTFPVNSAARKHASRPDFHCTDI